eukprot:838842-Heterocapsa_arctica.AAC.1
MAYDRPSHQWIYAVAEALNAAGTSSAPGRWEQDKPIKLTGAEFLGPQIPSTKHNKQGGTRRGYLKRLRGAGPAGR